MPERTYITEKDVKNEVKKLLTQHGWFWWMPPANGFGKGGIADINAIRSGVFMAVETKFGTRKLRPTQAAYLETIAAHEGFGFVVSDRTVETFATFLKVYDEAVEAVSQGVKPSQVDGATMLNCVAELTQPVVAACSDPAPE